MDMFCFQCSETVNAKGCTVRGVCGKDSTTAGLQDSLVWSLKGLSYWAVKAREACIDTDEVDLFVAESLFSTLTNVNFDPDRIFGLTQKAFKLRANLMKAIEEKTTELPPADEIPSAAIWRNDANFDKLKEMGITVGPLSTENEDIRSLRELLVYGLKGISAYADHAYILNHSDDNILHFIEETLVATLDDSLSADDYVALVMKTGEQAVNVMALLDKANTSSFGNPEMTMVFTGTVDGPGILVSGHDLLDMRELLEQTAKHGVNVYTHGEMLPAHAYPELKRFDNLIGNFGTSWYNQNKEFEAFKGPVVMTTNCLQKPRDSYKDRIYTTGLVGWPGIKHIPNRTDGSTKDFSEVIDQALRIGSIGKTTGKKIPVGFAHNQLTELSDKIIDAVKSGAIRRFIVMAGCDGRAKERQYYTDVAEELPSDTVILTAGCAKYRYNMLDLGDIGGIPRVIDAGQCNDSYSLAVIALKLKETFGLSDINDLPISYDIAWYEQKAVAVLLALLSLGIKKIRLGPVLPAFLSPNITKVLVEKFEIMGTGEASEDISLMMAGK
ncbi:MAG TPA: hydroxylamine reductase [Kosmotogaceae bacterium]|nr:hydroxylamine reductase [Kosmotogaceae bacterium]